MLSWAETKVADMTSRVERVINDILRCQPEKNEGQNEKKVSETGGRQGLNKDSWRCRAIPASGVTITQARGDAQTTIERVSNSGSDVFITFNKPFIVYPYLRSSLPSSLLMAKTETGTRFLFLILHIVPHSPLDDALI